MSESPRNVADAVEAEAFVDMFDAMDHGLARSLGLRHERVGRVTLFLAPAMPTSMFNRAIAFDGAQPFDEAELDETIASFERARSKAFWLHAHEARSVGSELGAALVKRGFGVAKRATWTKFLRGIEPPPPLESPLAVREIDERHAAALAEVLAGAHQMPPAIEGWIASLVGRPSWHAYGAFDGTTLVGGGMLFLRGGRAWLGLGGTAPSHRGKGGQKLVMAARVADCIAAGASAIATETGTPVGSESNPSHANMVWYGFSPVSYRENWTRPG